MHTIKQPPQLVLWYDINEDNWNVNVGIDSPMPVFESKSKQECINFIAAYKFDFE